MHNLRLRSGKKKLSDLLSPRTSFDSEDEPVSEEETSNEAVDEVKFVFYSASETIQLGCVRFHTISAAPIQPVSVMNTNGSSSWDTNPTNLIDTDCSFYWKDNNYCSRGKSEIIFKFNERVSINNYELFTSPNTPEADPIKWRVYGRTSATASGTPSGWKLMDSRKNFSPPTEREETYGLIAFNYGKEETRSPIHAATNSVLHINPQKVRLYTSNEVSGLWTCERASFCLEYDTVHQKIAINHKYMATTILQQRMNEIDNMIAKKKNTRTFCTIVQIGISLAFSVPEHTVKYYCNPEDGMNYFNSIMKLFESFAWRQPYMSHAFEILVEQNRVSELKDVIGRLSRVASGVPTIKIEAFHYLIHLALDKTVISEQQAATTLSKKFLCFLDDYKINAFRSSFIEPTTFYYYLTLQKEKIEQAEIHCTNLYSALLLSTLGIQIPIMPYFMDESSACPPFLRIKTKEIKEAFKLMVKSAHFSEPWHKISYCKSLCVTKIQELPMNITENLATAIEISNKAIDVSPENQAFRKEVSEYMNRFAKFFTKEYIYEKMYIVLSAECQDELLSFFRNLRAANAKLEKYKTPKEWLYTKRGFNVERAHVLFTYLGFVEE